MPSTSSRPSSSVKRTPSALATAKVGKGFEVDV